jgi:Transcriptional regulator
MRGGQETRNRIIERSAVLFNEQGYSGSTMSDIMEATGLKKGGIYRHFKNKDELALEAFDHAVDVLRRTIREAVYGKETAEEKLMAALSVYMNAADAPPLQGGCPLLNTAVDTDDTHPMLSMRAREAMQEWLSFVQSMLVEGVQSGAFKSDLNVQETAGFLTSAFEGSIMMSRLYRDNGYMEQFYRQISQYIDYCVKR